MGKNVTIEKVVNLCKGRGFVFAGSEIYGGLANTWDYGPLGCELIKNIQNAWWKQFVTCAQNSAGVDAGILMNPRVWEASGHVAGFSDPLMDCKECKMRVRADNLIGEFSKGKTSGDAMTHEQMENYIAENKIKCPTCGKSNFTKIRQFNLMFKTNRGVVEDSQSVIYLRPESAQGEFVNFLNVMRSMRLKMPFGIGQIGKAFRNEVTPGNFIFRTIEFMQMEHQWFCKAGQDEAAYKFYKDEATKFFTGIGLPKDTLRFRDHEKLAHYAKAACDSEYKFPEPLGWGELNGTHNRTDYDLKRHQEYSGKSQEYIDPVTNERYIPYVVESSFGLNRAFFALLCEAYEEEEVDGETRTVLRLKPSMAPVKVAVLPLQKNKLGERAEELFRSLQKDFSAQYDETASIGKRYRRQDEIGTPFCVTVDFDTLEDNAVTVRERDSMKQERIKIADLKNYLAERIS